MDLMTFVPSALAAPQIIWLAWQIAQPGSETERFFRDSHFLKVVAYGGIATLLSYEFTIVFAFYGIPMILPAADVMEFVMYFIWAAMGASLSVAFTLALYRGVNARAGYEKTI